MATKSGIQKKYATCLNQAVAWLNRNGYPAFPKSPGVTTSKNADGDVEVSTINPIHLKGWPERPRSNKRIDIVFSVRDIVSLQDQTCLKANTRVTYFRLKDNTAVAVESLHYDTVVDPKPQHPIFHAQTNRRHVEPTGESFVKEVDTAPLAKRCQTVRIPTAFVNLPGILAILSADHMSNDHWREFMDTCKANFQNVPGLPPNPLVDNKIPDARLSAWSWYERQEPPNG